MIAPVQLTSYRLHEVHYNRNEDWEPPENQEVALVLSVQGVPFLEAEPRDPEAARVPFGLDVATAFNEIGPDGRAHPVGSVSTGTTYAITLYVGLNDSGDTASRSPVSARIISDAQLRVISVPDDDEARSSFADVVRANAAGMLYGMVRNLLLQLTQSTVKIILPSLTFQPIIEREREIEAAERLESDGG